MYVNIPLFCWTLTSNTLEKSKIGGHKLGAVAPIPVHKSLFHRALGSPALWLVDVSKIFV